MNHFSTLATSSSWLQQVFSISRHYQALCFAPPGMRVGWWMFFIFLWENSPRTPLRMLVWLIVKFTVHIVCLSIALLLQCVCLTNFIWTFNFESKVSHDIFRNKNECQLSSTFHSKMSPQCHMPSSTCHSNFYRVNWCVVFFFTSDTACQILSCACQLTRKVFGFKL